MPERLITSPRTEEERRRNWQLLSKILTDLTAADINVLEENMSDLMRRFLDTDNSIIDWTNTHENFTTSGSGQYGDDVTIDDNGKGLVVTSPDGLTTKRIGIDNDGNVVVSDI